MKIILALSVLFAIGCVARKSTPAEPIIGRPGAESFKLSQEAGFQDELLELKDGRFRYWFHGDVVISNPPNYPIEGEYKYEGDQLLLSDGQAFVLRELHGVRALWKPFAIEYWEKHRIIHTYGVLLQVQAADSSIPTLKPFFTPEQWAESAEAVRRLERAKKSKASQPEKEILGKARLRFTSLLLCVSK